MGAVILYSHKPEYYELAAPGDPFRAKKVATADPDKSSSTRKRFNLL
jgi:hypothetical protein